jgi:hypothetical protein
VLVHSSASIAASITSPTSPHHQGFTLGFAFGIITLGAV